MSRSVDEFDQQSLRQLYLPAGELVQDADIACVVQDVPLTAQANAAWSANPQTRLEPLNLDLIAGRIDAGLADFSVWKSFLETAEGSEAKLYGPRLSGGPFGPGVGIGLRKSDDELTAKVNMALEKISLDGTLKQISLKWFGADLVSK